jgi:hypothetical protein
VEPATVQRELADAGVSILPAGRIPRIAQHLART